MTVRAVTVQGRDEVARSRVVVVLALAVACLGCIAMLVLRGLVASRFQMRFMVWNLFLAAVPVPFAWLVDVMDRRRMRMAAMVVPVLIWLAFFPNAPYLVTDLVHLKPNRLVPLWYDGLVFFAFAATGLMLGLTSLYLVQAVVTRRAGALTGWVLAGVAIMASGYGIYLGRVERWNSWDVITNPRLLFRSVKRQVEEPLSNRQAILLTVGFTFFLSAVYLLLRAFASLVSADDAANQGRANSGGQ